MNRINFLQELVPSLRISNWAPLMFGRKPAADSASLTALCELIMQSDGEYSSMALAEQLLDAFESANEQEQQAFFTLLSEQFGLDCGRLQLALDEYRAHRSADHLAALTQVAQPVRRELLRRLNQVPAGTPRLVRMREQLQKHSRQQPELATIDVDFRASFNEWFNRGFLVLQAIDWTTPAHILEKIIAYEAVHEISNWRELRARLQPADRFCFGFFHPAMQDEPLVFVAVALTRDIPAHLPQILGDERDVISPEEAQCAVFYSISNCHRGLQGVSFGNFLIKHVARRLLQQFPQLKTFATLSPAPGFRAWLSAQQNANQEIAELLQVTNDASQNILEQAQLECLQKQAARYFLSTNTADGYPNDPVARFHLRNGAQLHRLNPNANLTEKGMQQSLGLMVNYVYDLDKVEQLHEQYVHEKRIACHADIKNLASA
ncbi:MAG: decarboxylase [Gammaproteobacteria bacterium]|nr:decarboxylase [Gammaproteobacteria bacterium]